MVYMYVFLFFQIGILVVFATQKMFCISESPIFFTESDLPWLLFFNSLCKHGLKTVFGKVL